jgi:hypothetical protein
MSGTNLNITLTAARLAEWTTNGQNANVNVYAVLFDSAGYVSTTTLVSNGSVSGAGTASGGGEDYTIPLTNAGGTIDGGKLYLVAESGTANIAGLITNQANINPGSASAYDFSYDSIEVSLLGKAADAANLTSVNGFALPMALSDSYGSVGYNVPGSTIVSDISAISSGAIGTYTSGGLVGQFMMAASPTAVNLPSTIVTTTGAYPQAAWVPYVTALETIASQVTISGQFNGAPDATGAWHNAGYYAYTLSWDGTNFWLSPSANSAVQGYIMLTPQAIEQDIYSQVGTVSIYSAASTSSTLLATVPVGANTQWGAVLAQFLTGFTGGYYGQAGLSPNSQITGTVNLDQNNNWNPIYAFDNNLGTIVNVGSGGVQYDPYSKVFFDNSNSYGSPYSDALMSQFTQGGPLLSVANSSGTDVSALNLTIFGQTETPTGYVKPTITDYIAPSQTSVVSAGTVSTYAIPASNNSGANVKLAFYSQVGANAGVDLKPDTSIAISYLTGEAVDPTTGAVTPVWNTVTIDGGGTYALNGIAGGTTISDPTLWNNWTIQAGSSTAILNSSSPNTPGNLLLNLPTADQGVSWYQITVGAGTAYAKTYNFYTTTATVPAGTNINGGTATSSESGVFLNPAYSGQAASQAIDGLAGVVGPTTSTGATQYTNTMTLAFAKGSTITYNPNLVVENTGSNANAGAIGYPNPAPFAVVADVVNNGTFSSLTNETYSTSGTYGGVISTSQNEFVLGWAGYNTNDVLVTDNVINNGTGTTASGGTGWTGSGALNPSVPAGDTFVSVGTVSGIGGYTNLVNAKGAALITVETNGTISQPYTIAADVNGDWVSNTASFGIGTYTITMAGAIDQGGTYLQDTQTSAPLVLDVTSGAPNLAPGQFVLANILTPPCFAAGTAIETEHGARPVESLAAGDVVRTISGALRRIRWVGRRTVDCARHPTPAAVRPVRIAAHAFGPGLPARTLDLSPDHAVYAEGVLVPVKHLINGTTIRQRRVNQVTYHHIELDSHDVILAEGLPAETYLDTGDRASFANAEGAVALHPAWGSEARDISLIMDALGAAPLRVTGPEVEKLRAQLAARSLAVATARTA